ncbi:uncharacterized protein LOC131302767 [Rhododendron vialii]|uniref:uncharacterized protein LOC131302767 n=1 Tax=Rhododendron vialii TaxID=182163 RepID=UPI00265F4785|nr:uncharacterized protein LOC131302767 [Rhododendron vialii]
MGELMTIIENDCVHEEAIAERYTPKAPEPAKTTGPKKQVTNVHQGQEELAAARHLNQWIDVRRNPLPPHPPVIGNLISVIQGLVSEGRATELRSEIDRAVASLSVCNVGASGKRKWEDPSFGSTITFSSDDLKGVQLPHTDALVVTVAIEKSTVQRVLIDQGSLADVMFYSTFQSLGLSPAHLRTASTPLVSFTGAPVWPLGLITLPV